MVLEVLVLVAGVRSVIQLTTSWNSLTHSLSHSETLFNQEVKEYIESICTLTGFKDKDFPFSRTLGIIKKIH